MTLDRGLMQLVVEQTEYLSRLTAPSLETLVEKAKSDPRVRLILPFYGHLKYPNKWNSLARNHQMFKSYDRLMDEALGRLESSSSPYAAFAYQLRDKFFSHHTVVSETYQYDEAEEMKKMVKTWFNLLNRDALKYQRAKTKADALLDEASFEDLLKPAEMDSKSGTHLLYKKSPKSQKNLVLARAK